MQFPFIQAPRNISGSNEKGLFISFYALLWPKFKSIHKTNEDPDFHHAEIECQTDNISKRYFDNGVNKKGTNSSDGHLMFLLQTLGFLVNKKNLCYIHARFYSY